MESSNAGATGALIAQRRREKGWSQAELAEKLHVTDKAVSKWETGRSLPGIDCLEPLAEALDLQVLELLRGRRLLPEAPAEARAEVREVLAYSRREVRRRTRSQRRRYLAALLALLLAAGLGLWRSGLLSPRDRCPSPAGDAVIRIYDGTPGSLSAGKALSLQLWEKRDWRPSVRVEYPGGEYQGLLVGTGRGEVPAGLPPGRRAAAGPLPPGAKRLPGSHRLPRGLPGGWDGFTSSSSGARTAGRCCSATGRRRASGRATSGTMSGAEKSAAFGSRTDSGKSWPGRRPKKEERGKHLAGSGGGFGVGTAGEGAGQDEKTPSQGSGSACRKWAVRGSNNGCYQWEVLHRGRTRPLFRTPPCKAGEKISAPPDFPPMGPPPIRSHRAPER